MIARAITASLLGLTLSLPVQAVEILEDRAMGGVQIYAGDVLSVLGAPAAGEVLIEDDGNGLPAPIEQTAGEAAAISMALLAPDVDQNRPERDVTRDLDRTALVFQQLVVEVPTVRNVPALFPGDGGMSFRILPGDKHVTASVERLPGATTDSLRINNNVRVDEVRVENVRFPGGSNFMANSSIVISGLEVEANALISDRR